MNSENNPWLVTKDKLKNLLLEVADPKMRVNTERVVENLANLVRSNPDLSDEMLENLILRQVFNICDGRKLGQARLVSRKILNQMRHARS